MKAIIGTVVLGLAFLTLATGVHCKQLPKESPAGRGSMKLPAADSLFVDIQLPSLRSDRPMANTVLEASGVVRPGTDTTFSLVLPVTDEITAVLAGDSVRWTFGAPDGALIVPGSTPNRSDYRGGRSSDLPGFWLRKPKPGKWSVNVRATSSRSSAPYLASMKVAANAPRNAHLETMARAALPLASNVSPTDDVVFVRAYLVEEGRPVPGVRWNVRMTTTEKSIVPVAVFDDGRHADAAADDGVFVGALRVGHSEGFCVLRAIGQATDGVEYYVHAIFEISAESEVGK